MMKKVMVKANFMQDSDNKLPLLNYSEGIKYNLGYSHDLSIYKI